MAFVDEIDALGATAHWRLDETSGAVAVDRIGGDDATLGANVTLAATGGGDDGNDGMLINRFLANSFITINSPSATDGVSYDSATRTDRSFVIIVYHDDDTNDACFLHMGSRDNGLFMYQFGSDGLLYVNATNGNLANHSASSAASLATATWQMLTLVQNDAANEINVYRNDDVSPLLTVDISSWSSATMPGQVTFADFLGSGSLDHRARLHDNSVRFSNQGRYDGVIDEIAYFSGIKLTQSDRATLWDVYLNGASTGTNVSGSITQGGQTFSASTEVQVSISGALTQGGQVLAGEVDTGTFISGSLTQGGQTLSGDIESLVVLSGTLTQGGQSVSGAAGVEVSVSGTLTQGGQVLSGDVSLASVVSGSLTQGGQSVSGTVELDVSVSGSLVQGGQSLSGTVSVDGGASISGSITQGGQTFAGNVEAYVALSGGLVQGGQVLSGDADLIASVSGSLVQGGQSFSGNVSGAGVISGALTQGGQALSGSSEVVVTVSGGLIQGGQVLSGASSLVITVNGSLVQGGATLSGTVSENDGIGYALATLTISNATEATLTISNAVDGTLSLLP